MFLTLLFSSFYIFFGFGNPTDRHKKKKSLGLGFAADWRAWTTRFRHWHDEDFA
jgi:hypothetical protein